MEKGRRGWVFLAASAGWPTRYSELVPLTLFPGAASLASSNGCVERESWVTSMKVQQSDLASVSFHGNSICEILVDIWPLNSSLTGEFIASCHCIRYLMTDFYCLMSTVSTRGSRRGWFQTPAMWISCHATFFESSLKSQKLERFKRLNVSQARRRRPGRAERATTVETNSDRVGRLGGRGGARDTRAD